MNAALARILVEFCQKTIGTANSHSPGTGSLLNFYDYANHGHELHTNSLGT